MGMYMHLHKFFRLNDIFNIIKNFFFKKSSFINFFKIRSNSQQFSEGTLK